MHSQNDRAAPWPRDRVFALDGPPTSRLGVEHLPSESMCSQVFQKISCLPKCKRYLVAETGCFFPDIKLSRYRNFVKYLGNCMTIMSTLWRHFFHTRHFPYCVLRLFLPIGGQGCEENGCHVLELLENLHSHLLQRQCKDKQRERR